MLIQGGRVKVKCQIEKIFCCSDPLTWTYLTEWAEILCVNSLRLEEFTHKFLANSVKYLGVKGGGGEDVALLSVFKLREC